MSVIIKSDQTAVNTIGNVYGLNGALDFIIMLDFNRGLYKYVNEGVLKDISLADAISLTRASKAGYKDRNGVSQVANNNEPRIHFMQDLGLSGLLIEPTRENLLLNPNTPVTQTVIVPTVGTLKSLALSVEGTGSATMSGGVAQLSRVSATQGNPQGAIPVGESTASVTVTITGNVTRFQLELGASTQGGSFASSFIPSGQTTRASDTVVLSELLSPKLATARTVVAQFAYHDRLVKNFASITNVFSLEDALAPEGGIYVSRGVLANLGGSSQKTVAIKANSTSIDKSNAMPSVDARKITTAISYSTGGGDLLQSVNGMVKGIEGAVSGFDIDSMTLGSKQGFGSATGEAGGVLTRLAVFDRQLTRDELAKISTSWL